MDNSADPSSTSAYAAQWAPSRVGGAALGVGGVVLLIAAFAAASDAAGMVLMAVAGLLLLGFSAHALLVRPRLAVGAGPVPELTVGTITGTHTYRRDQIERIRLVSMRRIGRRTGQLEIDLADDDRLIVFGRWDLGTDLTSVVDVLRGAGFPVVDGS